MSQHSGEAQNKCPPTSIILAAKSASVAWAMCKPFCFPSAHRCACVWKTDFSASTPVKKRRRKATPEWAFASSWITGALHHASWPGPAVSLHWVRRKHRPQTIWKYATQQFASRAPRVNSSTNKSRAERPKSEKCRGNNAKTPSSNLLVTQGMDTAVAADTSEW